MAHKRIGGSESDFNVWFESLGWQGRELKELLVPLGGGSRCLSGTSCPIIITEGPSPVCCPSLSLSNCNTFTLLQIRKQMRGLVIVCRVLTSGNNESMPSEKSSFRV